MARNAVADPDLQIRGEGGGGRSSRSGDKGEGVWLQGTAKYDIISTYVLPQKTDEIPPPQTANQYALHY